MLVFIVIHKIQKVLKMAPRAWGFLVVLGFHLKINGQGR